MITLRKSAERGRSNFGWLDSRHTFSFGRYYDPAHLGFRSLRVINDDRVAGGGGFDSHPHENMEILSWVVEGAMEHRDSMGNGSVMHPGELQRMTAGTGVTHSEFNHSKTDPLRFLQIWIVPEAEGLEPGYEQRAFPLDENRGELLLVASRDGREGSVTVHQDVSVYAGRFAMGDTVTLGLAPERHAWVQLVRGALRLGDRTLEEGDGAAVSGETSLTLAADSEAEALVFVLG